MSYHQADKHLSPGHPSNLPEPVAPIYIDNARSLNFFQVLKNRKWTLLGCLLAGGLLATLIVWRQPYVYQARALLEMQGINENILNSREVDPTARTDNSSESYINTEAQILQSTPVFERVARHLNTDAARPDAVRWIPPISVSEIVGTVRVRTHENDRIVELSVDSRDPRRAAAIANALTTDFIQEDLEARWKASQRTTEWLAGQLEDLGSKLRNSENQLQQFTTRERMIIDNSSNVAGTGLREVQDELERAQADRMAKESILAGIKTAPTDVQPALLGDGTLQQYQIQLTSLRKELAQVEAIYAPDYYKIPPLKAQISVLQNAYDRQRLSVLNQMDNDFRAAQNREKLVQDQYQSQFITTADQSSKMVEYDALKSAVDMNRTIYSQILQKVKGYGVASAMQTSNVRIVQPASVPAIPNRPNKPLIAVLAALGSLFAGMIWVFTRAAGDTSIHEPGEAQMFVQSPELGVIPSAKSNAGSYGRTRRIGSVRTPMALETVTWYHTPSLIAESFRSTIASVLLPGSAGKHPNVLLITSLNPGEGKTTVASNLAIALAGTSRRVLLIDGDRRRPRLHKVFGRTNDKGLSDILESASSPALGDFVLPTSIPNLWLLPSGLATAATPDLLYSERMGWTIARCRDEFDLVVIDTPPVLHLPDARILGRLSDGVILVLRSGCVRSDSIVAGERRLRMDGVPVLGTILNDWNPDTSGYGAYPGYDYA